MIVLLQFNSLSLKFIRGEYIKLLKKSEFYFKWSFLEFFMISRKSASNKYLIYINY